MVAIQVDDEGRVLAMASILEDDKRYWTELGRIVIDVNIEDYPLSKKGNDGITDCKLFYDKNNGFYYVPPTDSTKPPIVIRQPTLQELDERLELLEETVLDLTNLLTTLLNLDIGK